MHYLLKASFFHLNKFTSVLALLYSSILNLLIHPYASISHIKQLPVSCDLYHYLSRGEIMYFRRLEDLRVDHDLTQQKIADYLHIQREVYRRYEKGTRTIPVEMLIELADYYGTNLDYLVGRTNYKKKL